MDPCFSSIAPLKDKILISCLAGVSFKELPTQFPFKLKCMPNLGCSLGKGLLVLWSEQAEDFQINSQNEESGDLQSLVTFPICMESIHALLSPLGSVLPVK